LRTEGYQALRCPTCGGGIFVLPRSPLPELPPDESAGERRRREPPPPEIDVEPDEPIQYRDPQPAPIAPQANIVWLDDEPTDPSGAAGVVSEEEIPEEYRTPAAPEPAEVTAESRGPDRPRSARAAASGVRRSPTGGRAPQYPSNLTELDEPAEEDELAAPVALEPPVPLTARLAGWAARRKGALFVLGALGFVATTLAYNAWRGYREQLPHTAEVNWVEGQEAFDRAEYDVAKQKLARAAWAFRQLGSRDERTQQAVQLAAEAAIFADLSTYGLNEILDEAARSDPEQWPRRFEAAYKGRSLILDVEVEGPPPEGASAGAYPLAYYVALGRGPDPSRIGRIDLNGFKLFEDQKLQQGDSVLFGARLAAVRLVGSEWRFSFEPESGVLMSRFENLKPRGWVPRDSVSVEPAAPGRRAQ
jgi:hypothetical protein